MKHMKRMASLLMALAMALTLAVPVLAADADLSNHTYKAYQIFSGTQAAADDASQLGNIDWGSGINDGAFLTALKNDQTIGSAFTNCETAADVAEAMNGWANKGTNAMAFAKVAYDYIKDGKGDDDTVDMGRTVVNGQSKLDAGYYLVVDVTPGLDGGENTVHNLALLQLTKKGTFDIENKTDVPEMQKKVKDVNDSVANSATDWQDSADYDIGDAVPFQLKATLPTNYADYEHYYLAFHDQESEGLDFNASSVKVYVGSNEITEGFEVVTQCEDGCTFEVVFKDMKAIKAAEAGSVITVEYTSTLNENAKIGAEGNPNQAQLEYSNNPNTDYDGQDKDDETGKTPWDKVIVFTYKVVVNKTDGKAPLKGAGFTLYKKQLVEKEEGTSEFKYVAVGEEVKGDEMTTFTWVGLDDGDYKLVETTTPAGYNTIDPIEFAITAEHQVLSDNPTLTKLEGGDMFTGEVSTGTLTASVVNNSGATLPETGGMGTTLFYALGAVLVIGAGVAMVTKKRMG